MGYQRASWRSGLTYEQVCSQCKTKVTYMDDRLDFRPWYPDGFVYCPTCNTPLRHNEKYAINRPEQPASVDISAPIAQPVVNADVQAEPGSDIIEVKQPEERAKFCSSCGKAFGDEDNFCSSCGKKR